MWLNQCTWSSDGILASSPSSPISLPHPQSFLDSKRRCSYNRPASTTDSDMGATYGIICLTPHHLAEDSPVLSPNWLLHSVGMCTTDSPRRNDSLNGHHHHHSCSMRASSGHSHGMQIRFDLSISSIFAANQEATCCVAQFMGWLSISEGHKETGFK